MKTYYVTVTDSTGRFNICEGTAEASSDGVAIKRFIDWAERKVKLMSNIRKGGGIIVSIVRSA